MQMVLIADDDSALRRLLHTMLADAETRVLEAADGDAAWALIQEHHPPIVVLDVNMPGRSGLAVAQAIRQTPDLATVQIVLLTGLRADEDIAAGLAAGADHYLTKPFSPLALLACIEASWGAIRARAS